ncbi:endonuclease/exonuclease/phosphatase family protein [Jiangella anatolica]|uniref:Endonuclease/exonuclease/phosphatase domain-containing protein n=1 Tax=Jiangella anatolica TaxID=2670374 RepID=A0A2W2BW29_9ACTN|nr:endonuclease/exonuclease/phosphatase family protein [Jiangella anatolica]PZF79817.1 hypothetical protein C1I92_29210 [Jiangella anatolica]
MPRITRRVALRAGLLTTVAALSLTPVTTASADDAGRAASDLPPIFSADVATYNLYLGATLDPLFTATTPEELVRLAGEVYAGVEATNFPERAGAIADQIAEHDPEVVGLQEVALWEKGPLGGQLQVTYDFLDLLLDELAERGHPYRAVATNWNFDGTLPISAAEQARFRDRDVIIVRADLPRPLLQVTNPQSGTYAAVLQIPTAIPGVTFESPRGWSTVDVRLLGARFRFANTHLEASGPAAIRNAQAAELAGLLDASPLRTVLVGDLNSRPNDVAGAYGILTGAGFADAWLATGGDPATGFTAGQTATLLDENRLRSRIDYVLTGDGIRPLSAEVIGDEEADRSQPTGFWPSDHAGVVATLRFTR